MATAAGAGDRVVIDIGVGPVAGHMAIIADIVRGNMGRRFARRGAAVMATAAGAEHRNVIDIGIGPVTGHMAIVTDIG